MAQQHPTTTAQLAAALEAARAAVRAMPTTQPVVMAQARLLVVEATAEGVRAAGLSMGGPAFQAKRTGDDDTMWALLAVKRELLLAAKRAEQEDAWVARLAGRTA